MVDSQHTWDTVVDAAGGTAVVADGLTESTSTVSGWRKRPRGIPGEHWSGIVRLAVANGRPDITLEVLARLASRRANAEEART
jgi:hypothetical protein